MQLVVRLLLAVRRLVLEEPEPVEVAVLGQQLLHARDAVRPDQLVLQVAVAHVEPGAGERTRVRLVVEPAEQGAAGVPHLADVDQPGEAEVLAAGPVPRERAADRHRSPDRHDQHARGVEVEPVHGRRGADRRLVAATLDEDRGDGRRLRHGTEGVSPA